MGLFDFVKDVGKKVFGNEAEASDKIRQEIEQDNPGIKGLTVTYDKGVVSLAAPNTKPSDSVTACTRMRPIRPPAPVIATLISFIDSFFRG